MKGRAIVPIALATLLAGMGAWIYFYEIKGEAAREDAEAAAKKVLSVDRDAVTGLKITNKNGTFELAKADGEWRLTHPIQVQASKEAAEDIVSAAVDFEAARTLSDAAGRLSAFGLDSPRATLTLVTADGETSLAFGGDAPFKNQYYVRKTDGTDVLIVADPLRNLLEKDLASLRNRSLVSFNSHDVTRFSVEGPDLPGLVVAKVGAAWRAGGGADFRLKKRAVDDLLYDLTQVEAADFVDDPATVSFDAPTMRLSLEVASPPPSADPAAVAPPPTTYALTVGAPQGEGEAKLYPVRREDTGSILMIHASSIDALTVRADELRDRSPIAIDRWQTDRIIAIYAGETMTAEKEAAGWKVSPPDATWQAKDVSKLMDLLGAAEAETFLKGDSLAEFGLDTPTLTLTFAVGAEGQEQRVRLATGANGKTFAQNDSEPTVYQLPENVLPDLVALLKPPPAPPKGQP